MIFKILAKNVCFWPLTFRCYHRFSTSTSLIRRTFSSAELKPNFDSLEESTKFPYSPLSNDDDISQFFFEQFVSHELMLKKDDVTKIYFLYSESIKKNYPSNESIINLCRFLKLFFTGDDINFNPKPFLMPFQQLYNRILLLKEIGFRSFHISMIDSAADILNLNSEQLKKHLNYPAEKNCFETLCKVLDIYGENKSKLIQYIKDNLGDLEHISVHDLRILCIANYLSNYLQLPFNRVHHNCRRFSKHLNDINIATIKTNVTQLQNYFNYSGNKIIHNALFLHVNPENLTTISSKLKPIVGDHIYENLIGLPQILKLNFSQIVQNYELVKQKCDGKFFTRSIELLQIEPKKLRQIFDQIENNSDIQQMNLDVLGIDYLAIHRQKILDRIDELKRVEIPLGSVPLSFFHSNDSEFLKMINDMTSDVDLRIRFFLENRFNLDYEKIKYKLYVVPNLCAEKYCHTNANRIIEFLISMNIDKEQIVNFVYLIFYDYKQVRSAYYYLCNRFDKSTPKDNVFFHHLIEHLQTSKQSVGSKTFQSKHDHQSSSVSMKDQSKLFG